MHFFKWARILVLSRSRGKKSKTTNLAVILGHENYKTIAVLLSQIRKSPFLHLIPGFPSGDESRLMGPSGRRPDRSVTGIISQHYYYLLFTPPSDSEAGRSDARQGGRAADRQKERLLPPLLR